MAYLTILYLIGAILLCLILLCFCFIVLLLMCSTESKAVGAITIVKVPAGSKVIVQYR